MAPLFCCFGKRGFSQGKKSRPIRNDRSERLQTSLAAIVITVIAVVAGTGPNRIGKVPKKNFPGVPNRILAPEFLSTDFWG